MKKQRPWVPKVTQLNKQYNHDSHIVILQPTPRIGPLQCSDFMLVKKITTIVGARDLAHYLT